MPFSVTHERKMVPGLAAPRYTTKPFPPYRFISGATPHPTLDPRGHSFRRPGETTPSTRWVAPADWASSCQYLYAADLYNHGYWWEAHEAWEELWQQAEKAATQGRFLQGLIQVSACHLKLHISRREGVKRLLDSSMGYLDGVCREIDEAVYMGVDVADFVARVRRYYGIEGGEAQRTDHDPEAYPYVRFVSDPKPASGSEC